MSVGKQRMRAHRARHQGRCSLTPARVHVPHVCTRMHTHAHACTRVHTHMFACIHMHTVCTHIRTHAHTVCKRVMGLGSPGRSVTECPDCSVEGESNASVDHPHSPGPRTPSGTPLGCSSTTARPDSRGPWQTPVFFSPLASAGASSQNTRLPQIVRAPTSPRAAQAPLRGQKVIHPCWRQ